MKVRKEYIELLFQKFNDDLKIEGFEIDNHCEFVSVLREKDTQKVIAVLFGDNFIEWEDNFRYNVYLSSVTF